MIHLQVRLHLQVTILSHDRSNSIDGFIGSTPEKRGGIIDKKRETIKVGVPKTKTQKHTHTVAALHENRPTYEGAGNHKRKDTCQIYETTNKHINTRQEQQH